MFNTQGNGIFKSNLEQGKILLNYNEEMDDVVKPHLKLIQQGSLLEGMNTMNLSLKDKKSVEGLQNIENSFNKTLAEYNLVYKQFSEDLMNRKNQLNEVSPYLGKNIRNSNGAIYYVNNFGNYYWYSPDAWNGGNPEGCPTDYEQLPGEVPSQLTPGPNMNVGTPCGAAGQVVKNTESGDMAWVDIKGYKHSFPTPPGASPAQNPAGLFTVKENIAIGGNDINNGWKSNATIEQCENECKGISGCQAFSYAKTGAGCALKNGTTNMGDNTAYDTYVLNTPQLGTKMSSSCAERNILEVSNDVYNAIPTGNSMSSVEPCMALDVNPTIWKKLNQLNSKLKSQAVAITKEIQTLSLEDQDINKQLVQKQANLMRHLDDIDNNKKMLVNNKRMLVTVGGEQEDSGLRMTSNYYFLLMWILLMFLVISLSMASYSSDSKKIAGISYVIIAVFTLLFIVYLYNKIVVTSNSITIV